MQAEAPTSPGPASPPDPPTDQPGRTVPGNLGALLEAVATLLGYGRHLLDTIRQRAAAPSFPTIAVHFGTSNLATILAHLNRGILRATALERFLLARAATGRDIEIIARRGADEPPPAPAAPQADPAAAPAATPKAASRRRYPVGSNDPKRFMPTLEELEREVRRRPIGRTIADICLDLAVLPGLCTGPFWNQLFKIMHYLDGSVATVMRETRRRKQAFIQEQDRIVGSTWDWMRQTQDAVRQNLGFLIGDDPVDPFAEPAIPATAALATGPP